MTELLLIALPPLVPIVPTLKYFGNKLERSPLVAICLGLGIMVYVLWHDNMQLREDRVAEQKERNKEEKERHSEEIVRMAKYDVIIREMKEEQAESKAKDDKIRELEQIVSKIKTKRR